ncbi:hypothetical protein Slin_4768 [Spirosoma linguale DSM 74]|uniref:Uncharacterized protein n=1 Tax=Spirosoma linguale (strain ATCC 33905 / DSM 74 / LMG 10896 / Claus 1) TaxID=504472 RepID=D2QQG5_SPILD|nr:hypothetical protein Slin_4768 [Spirosoma linguale DSM 74]
MAIMGLDIKGKKSAALLWSGTSLNRDSYKIKKIKQDYRKKKRLMLERECTRKYLLAVILKIF